MWLTAVIIESRSFSRNGKFVNKWNLSSYLSTPRPIITTGLSVLDDRLLITDAPNLRILELLLNGTFVDDWDLRDSIPFSMNPQN